MWSRLADWILANRLYIFLFTLIWIIGAIWKGSQVQLTYNFAKTIPSNHPKYLEYIKFKELFGEDGKLIVIGIEDKRIFEDLNFYKKWYLLADEIKSIQGVENVLEVGHAFRLVKDTVNKKFKTESIYEPKRDIEIKSKISQLPFYKGLLYNNENNTALLGVNLQLSILDLKKRNEVIRAIQTKLSEFETQHNVQLYISGLPLVRTELQLLLKYEMILFAILSVIISIITLYIFFRSLPIIGISLILIVLGIFNTLATLVVFDFRITMLTGLLPSLIVVIGIPNIIYLVNKYHQELLISKNKNNALRLSITNIGIVTLFTNLVAAIGFAVFGLTKSVVLREFGIVAGINILLLFIFSIILIPPLISYFTTDMESETKYIRWRWVNRLTEEIIFWVKKKKRVIYLISTIMFISSLLGLWHIHSNSYIVDDVPHNGNLYQDLKWFEKNYKGIMPFEILIDTRKAGRCLQPVVFQKLDELGKLINTYPIFSKPLSIAEGIKFVTQCYYNGDTAMYDLPYSTLEQSFIFSYLAIKDSSKNDNSHGQKLINSYMDSTKQYTRLSAPVADIGSDSLSKVFDDLMPKINAIFDSSKYSVSVTGTSVIFLEGNTFVIKGMRDSILYAVLSIVICMIILFRRVKIVFISLIPNIIPLLVIAGILGICNIPIKPSTVLVFGIALGISIDVTIRFLVFYAKSRKSNSQDYVVDTLKESALSIVYTSIILIAGFFIFVFSNFGGTKALGIFTSAVLLLSTLSNLTLLPCLLDSFDTKDFEVD